MRLRTSPIAMRMVDLYGAIFNLALRQFGNGISKSPTVERLKAALACGVYGQCCFQGAAVTFELKANNKRAKVF